MASAKLSIFVVFPITARPVSIPSVLVNASNGRILPVEGAEVFKIRLKISQGFSVDVCSTGKGVVESVGRRQVCPNIA